jgi:RNA polymerase sigma-70 factor (ECF subfamily)
MLTRRLRRPDLGAAGDEELLARARTRDEAAVRALVQRHNQRLFRIARAVVRDDAEAEDIVQETYVRAFTGLAGFRGESAFATWITRIALNEASGRRRRRRPTLPIDAIENTAEGRIVMFPTTPPPADPEGEIGRGQVRRFLERAVDALPEHFRLVFILRDVEGLSIEEAAALLHIGPQTVKTRLLRARRLLRAELEKAVMPAFSEVFPFAGERCAGMADRVVERLAEA